MIMTDETWYIVRPTRAASRRFMGPSSSPSSRKRKWKSLAWKRRCAAPAGLGDNGLQITGGPLEEKLIGIIEAIDEKQKRLM